MERQAACGVQAGAVGASAPDNEAAEEAPTPVIEDELYLFCDTNLFLQCRPLEDLDWSKWQEYGSVNVIVCAPVLREIDALKNKGNNRQSRKGAKNLCGFP